MKTLFIWLFLFFIIVLDGCQQFPKGEKLIRYYAPTNFVSGVAMETMLTTEFASVDIRPHGNTAELSFHYKGPGGEVGYSIDEFVLEFSGIPFETNGPVRSFNSDNTTGDISYTIDNHNNYQKKGSLTRSFIVSGTIDDTDPSHSSITFTSAIFNEQFTLSLQNITNKESAAEFGKEGYTYGPIISDRISANRLFVNNTGHIVTVGHEGGSFSYRDFVTIKAGYSDKITMIDAEEVPDASYTFKFDDARISHHKATDKPYEYSGIPVDVKELPFLSFDAGIIMYDKNYDVTYTITPEIYEHASFIE